MNVSMTALCNQAESLTEAFCQMFLSTNNFENLALSFSSLNAMAMLRSCKQVADSAAWLEGSQQFLH